MKRAWMVGALLLGCGARTGEAFPLGVNRSAGDVTGASVANGRGNDDVNGRGNDDVNGRGNDDVNGRGNDDVNGRGNDDVNGRGNDDVNPGQTEGTTGLPPGGSPDPALMPVDEPTTFDTCRSPFELPSDESLESSGTLPIAPSTNESTCFENGADLFFRWTAPRTGVYVFSTSGTEFDSVLTIYSADCGSQLGCNDDAPESTDLHAEVRVEVTEGENLVAVLSSYYDTSGGAYRVSVAPE